jgi:hypothetical protein
MKRHLCGVDSLILMERHLILHLAALFDFFGLEREEASSPLTPL